MKIRFSSQKRELLLFLTTNMAAVTSRANQQYCECLSDLRLSTSEICATQLLSVTEIAPKSLFLCVNRALYSMVLAPAQKLSGIVWTWPYSHILAKRYGMISFIFGSNTKDTRWHSNNQQVKQSISKVCTVHVFSTWSLRLRQTFQPTQRPL